MVGWHHSLNGPEFEQAPGDGEGHASQVCCSPWGHKESDTTERLNNNKIYIIEQQQSNITKQAVIVVTGRIEHCPHDYWDRTTGNLGVVSPELCPTHFFSLPVLIFNPFDVINYNHEFNSFSLFCKSLIEPESGFRNPSKYKTKPTMRVTFGCRPSVCNF